MQLMSCIVVNHCYELIIIQQEKGKLMKSLITLLASTVFGLIFALPANALLIDNTDGTLTSDTSGLMWLQDANLGGAMTWADAFTFVADVNSGAIAGGAGYTDWRLSGGSDCNSNEGGGNCFGSETFELFWELLTEHSTFLSLSDSPFVNGVSDQYWTSTEWTAENALAVDFRAFGAGGQNDWAKTSEFYALLVRDDGGDQSVPEPSIVALLAMGLIGVLGVSKRKART